MRDPRSTVLSHGALRMPRGALTLVLATSALVLSGSPAPAALAKPGASSANATNITSTSAVVHGTVSPNGQQTDYFVQYGTTSHYGQQTTPVQFPTANG